MSSVVAIVKSIVGQVIAVSPEGIRRVLIEGDRLLAGEEVLTGPGGAVTLELADGRLLDLGRDSQWSADAPDSSTDLSQATAQAAPSVEELQQAIAAGVDPTTELEATAAGPSAAGGGGALGGGHSFVMLEETAGRVDATVGFPTEGLGFATGLDSEEVGLLDTTSNNQVTTPTIDTNVATDLILGATPSISEAGGVIVYTATVGQAPTTNLVVTLSNGAVIVIPAGQTSGSVNVVVPANDTPYIDGGQISATVTGTTGGNGLTVTVPQTPAVTQVTDTIDTTTATLTANPSVTEGGVITYTVTLSNPAQTPVTVTLSNGQVITIEAGKTQGSVDFQTPANDVYNNGSTVSTTITGATGGNFEQLTPNPAPAETVISDSVDNTTATLTASPSVTEGGVITYTVTLSNPAQTPVTVTLSNGQTITVEAGKTQGSVDFQTPANDVYNNGSTVSVTIENATGGNFEQLTPNPTPAQTTINDSVDTTTATLTASPSVTEGGVITYTVTLSNPAQTPVTVTLSNGQTITVEAGKTQGSVDFQTPANDVYNNGSTVSVTIENATGGNFEQLTPNPTPAQTTINDSVDTTTATLTASPSVTEGGVITYTVTLSNPAQTPVTVTLSNGQTITVEAGKTQGSVDFQTPANDVYNNGSTVSVTIENATGGNFEQLTPNPTPAQTTINDSVDTTTATLTASPSVTEGGVITYTVTLSNPAQTPVTVTLSNGQTITVEAGKTQGSVDFQTPANDIYNNGSTVSVTIENATGGNFEQLTPNPTPAQTTINDSVDTTTATLTASPSVTEGGVITYTVTLSNPAQTPVTVTLSNGQTITVEAGKTQGSVDFQTPANDVYNNGSTVSVTIENATGGNFEQLTPNPTPAQTTINDSVDTTTATLTANPSVTEGGVITYTVTLSNPAQTPVTVTLSNGQTITVEAGKTQGSVDFQTPANDVYNNGSTVSVTIENATGGNFEQLTPNPTPASTVINDSVDIVTVSIVSNGNVTEDQQPSFTVKVSQALDRPLTVTLSNGDTVTIEAGKTEVEYKTPAQGDDVYHDADSITLSVTDASVPGATFEKLALGGPATVEISDTISEVVAKLTATPSVTEGGEITYTITLTNKDGLPINNHGALTFTLSDGKTVITVPANGTSGSITVTAPDNVYVGSNPAVVNSIATVAGADVGKFEQLTLDKSPVSTTVTDEPGTPGNPGGNNEGDLVQVTITADQNAVAENVKPSFTVHINQPLDHDLVVTLSNNAQVTIKAGETSAPYTHDAQGDDVYKDSGEISLGINSAVDATGATFENLQLGGAATVQVTDTIDEVLAKLTATPSVTEGGEITYTITLTNKDGLPINNHSELYFKLTDGTTVVVAANSTTGSATATAPDNAYVGTNQPVVNAIDAVSGADAWKFENLNLDKTPVSTQVTDEPGTPGNEGDLVKVTITADQTSVAENVKPTFTVHVNQPLDHDLVVTLSNNAQVTIKAGETSAPYTHDAQGDDVYKDSGEISLGINSAVDATGATFENLQLGGAATVQVTDTTDEVVAKLTATPSVTEGGEITYTITLTNKDGLPINNHGALTFTLSDGKTVITVPANGTSGSITVTAPDNVYVGSNTPVVQSIATVAGADVGKFEQLTLDKTPVSTTVTDEPGTPGNPGGNNEGDLVKVTITADQSSVAENVKPTFTVHINQPLAHDLVVTLSNNAQVTIKAGDTSAPYEHAAQGDDVYLDSGEISLGIKSAVDVDGRTFENLQLGGDASVQVTDTVDEVVAKLTASQSVTEGGEITYTITLTNKDGLPINNHAELYFKLTDGTTVIVPANSTTGSATATAPDNVYVGANEPVVNAIDAVSGADAWKFENLNLDKTPVSTEVTDEPGTPGNEGDIVKVTITADQVSVAENVKPTFTVHINTALAHDLVVTLSNNATVTIKAGETSAPYEHAAQGDDVYQDAGEITLGIKSAVDATGAAFENLQLGGDASVKVTDTIDEVVAKLTASQSVTEGGEITYTITLTNKDGLPINNHAELYFKLTDGTTVIVPANSTTGSATATAPDNVYVGANEPVVNAIDAVSGADAWKFENLNLDKTPVSTEVTDEPGTPGNEGDIVKVTITADQVSVAENVKPTFTVHINTALAHDLVVTLSNNATVTIKAGETSAPYEHAAQGDDVYQDAGEISLGIKSAVDATGAAFENLQLGGDASVKVTDTVDEVVAKLTASQSVTEGGEITYTITLTNKDGLPINNHAELYFKLTDGTTVIVPANSTTGSATATAPDNVYVGANEPVVNAIDAVSGADAWKFENLNLDKTPVSTEVTDEPGTPGNEGDIVKVTITADQVSVAENVKPTFTVHINTALAHDLVVTLSNNATVTIKAGETSAPYEHAAQGDDVYQDAGEISLGIKSAVDATGAAFENLQLGGDASVKVTDTVDEVVAKLTASQSVTEGGEITYTITLTNKDGLPINNHAELYFKLTDGTTVIVPANSTTGSATATAPDNVYVGANEPVVNAIDAVSGADAWKFENLTLDKTEVKTQVTDEPGTPGNEGDIVKVTITADQVSVNEATEPTFTITLNKALDKPFTVTLSTGATLVFAAGETTKSYAAPAQGEDVFKDEGKLIVSISKAEVVGEQLENLQIGKAASVAVTDTQSLVTAELSVSSGTVTEGGKITYTVKLVSDDPSLPVTNHKGLTFTLTDGTTVTIKAGEATGSTQVTAPDNVYVNDPVTITQSLTGVTGKGADQFEQLELGKDSVSTTVTDEPAGEGDLVKVTIVADQVSVNEATEPTFTITLNKALDKPFTVTLSTGATLVFAAGETTKSYAAPAQGEDVFKDEGKLTVSISKAEVVGEQLENLVIGKAATVAVTDTPSMVTAQLIVDNTTVTEGGKITYTVKLVSDDPSLPVTNHKGLTFTLTDGTTVTIKAGEATGSTQVTAPDNVYVNDPVTITQSLTGVTGKGADQFEQLELGKDSVSTTVTDEPAGEGDLVKVTIVADQVSVNEATEPTFTITLNKALDKPFTVTLSTGATLVFAAGETTKSYAAPAQGDDVFKDEGKLTVSISKAEVVGEQLENLVIGKAATVAVTDTPSMVTAQLIVDNTSVAEGGKITYTVKLVSDDPSLPVTNHKGLTFTLTDGTTVTIKAGEATGSTQVTAPDNVYVNDPVTITQSLTGVTGKGADQFEQLELGKDSVSTTVTDEPAGEGDLVKVTIVADQVSVNEATEPTFTLSLNKALDKDFTVTLSTGATVVFAAGETTKTYAAPAQGDDVFKDEGKLTVSISKAEVVGEQLENLQIGKAASVAVTDTQSLVTAELSVSSGTVTEGGKITYTVKLVSDDPSLPVTNHKGLTFTLTDGTTVTVKAGESEGSVTVSAPDNVYVNDPVTITQSLTGVTGKGADQFEQLELGKDSVSTTVTDEPAGEGDLVKVTIVADQVSVNEATEPTFTLSLNKALDKDFTVTLSTGATVVFAAGETTKSYAAPAQGDDVFKDEGKITVSISQAEVVGEQLENLQIGKAASVAVTDTQSLVTAELSVSSGTVTEGGKITYTVKLVSDDPSLPVTNHKGLTFTLTDGTTVTVKAGESEGSVTVSAPDNVYVNDPVTITQSLTGVTGKGADQFEQLELGKDSVSTTVTDEPAGEGDLVKVTIVADQVSVNEATEPTFTLSLNKALDKDFTVTLSTGATVVFAAGETTKSYAAPAQGDDVFKDEGKITVSISQAEVVGEQLENLQIGKAASVAVTDTQSLVTAELSVSSGTVTEGGKITYTVKLVSDDPSLPVTNHKGLTFTLTDGTTVTVKAGESEGSVTVSAPDNVYVNDPVTITQSLTGVTGKGADQFEQLELGKDSVSTTVTDEPAGEGDLVKVTIVADQVSVNEATEPTFTLSLNKALDKDFTVTLSTGATVVFAAGETTKSYAAPAQGDDVFKDEGKITVSISQAEVVGEQLENLQIGKAASVAVTDTQSLVTAELSVSSGTVTEGGKITYTVKLVSDDPSLPVTNHKGLTFTLTDGTTVTVKAGESEGSVTVSAPDNVYVNDPVTITQSLTGVTGKGADQFEQLELGKDSVSTTVTDEPAGEGDLVKVTIVADQVSVNEATEPTFTLSLNKALDKDFTVTLSTGATVVFAAGETTKSYAAPAQGDDVFKDEGKITVSISQAEVVGEQLENLQIGKAASVAVTDTQSLVTAELSVSSGTVTEGGKITYTVKLVSDDPSLPVTNHKGLTFTLTDGTTVTVKAGESEGSVTVSAPDNVYVNDPVTITQSLTGVTGKGADQFEQLELGKDSVSTTVTDEPAGEGDLVKVTIVADQVSVNEATEPTFTLSLNKALDKDFTVTLSTGATVVFAAGETTKTYAAPAQGDDVFKDEGKLTVSISQAEVVGEQLENLVIGKAATVAVTDTQSVVTAQLIVDNTTVAEGGKITYTVKLVSDDPSLPVTNHKGLTFTLTDGTTVTIKAGEATGSTQVTAPDNVYVNDPVTITQSLTGVTGKGADQFEQLELGKDSVSTTVTDEPAGEGDLVKVTIVADQVSVNEATEPTFTLSLNKALDKDFTVTLSTGATVVFAAGETTKTYAAPAQGDDVFKDEGKLTVSISKAEVVGEQLENLVIGKAATVAVTDTPSVVTAQLIVDNTTVAEGGKITYTVKLVSDDPSLPVTNHKGLTFTLTDGTTVTVKAGESEGSVTMSAPDNVYVNDPVTITQSLTGVTGEGADQFEQLELGKDSVSTKVVDEPGVGTPGDNNHGDKVELSIVANQTSVFENEKPTFTISIKQALDQDLTVQLGAGKSVVIEKGQTSAIWTNDAQGEDVYVDGGSLTVSITGTSVPDGRSFENLVLTKPSASVEIKDTLTEVVAKLTATEQVTEGGNIVYTVTLTGPTGLPINNHGALTFTLSDGKTTITVPANQSSGSVTVAAPDNVYIGESTVSLSLQSVAGPGASRFEDLKLDDKAASTKVVDESGVGTPGDNNHGDKVELSIVANQTSVFENEKPTFTISIKQALDQDLTVQLGAGKSVVIEKGQTSAIWTNDVQGEDVYVDGGSLTVSITGTSVPDGRSFENLVLTKPSASVEIKDTLTEVVAKLTATEQVTEGGNIVYTVTLTGPTGLPINNHGALTFTLSDGKTTITVPANQSSGSVTVAAPDNVYIGESTVSLSLQSVAGPGASRFEDLKLDDKAASTKVVDESGVGTPGDNNHGDKVELSIVANQTSVFENEKPTFTISIKQALDQDLTVQLGAGKSVVIEKGQTSAIWTNDAQGEDVYVDGGSLTVSITGTSVPDGRSFENLVLTKPSASVEIKDTLTEVVAKLTATEQVTEGGNIVYTVTLTGPTGLPINNHGALTFTLSDGKTTITVPANQTSGSVTVAAPDNVYIGESTVSLSLQSVAGPGASRFEDLKLDDKAASTKVVDESGVGTPGDNNHGDKVELSIVANQTSVFENEKPTFTISIKQALDQDLTVQLGAGKSVVIEKGQTSAIWTNDAQGEDVYVDGGSLTVSITGTSVPDGRSFENLVLTKPSASVEIKDTLTEVVAKLTATEQVTEGGNIVYTVTLTGPTGLPINNHGALTFTLSDGKTTITVPANQSSGSVTVAAPDNVYIGESTVSLSLQSVAGPGASRFEDLKLDDKAASTKVVDESGVGTPGDNNHGDKVELSIVANQTSVFENEKPTFTISIKQALDQDLTVQLGAGKSVVIEKGQTSAIWTNDAQGEDVYVDGGSLTVSITGTSVPDGRSFENLVLTKPSASVEIKDTLTEVVAKLTATEQVTEGGNIVYTVTLTGPTGLPINNHGALTFTLSDGKTTITVPANQSSGSVTVAAPDNVYIGESTVSLSLQSVAGPGASRFEDLKLDDKAASTKVVDESGVGTPGAGNQGDVSTVGITGTTSLTEGETSRYTLTLSHEAKAEVTITLSYSGTAKNGEDFTGVTTVTIPANSTGATFNIATIDDKLVEGAENFVVKIETATGGSFENLQVDSSKSSVTTTILDNDHLPVSTGGAVTGVEDTEYFFKWSDFNVTDADGNTGLFVTIASIPVDGSLKAYNSTTNTWSNVTSGQVVSQADIDKGYLKFVPKLNQSGIDGYGGAGVGNKQADYAQFKYKPNDGTNTGSEVTMKVDIAPQADKPTLSIGSADVVSKSLIKEVWTSLKGLGTDGNGITGDALKTVFANSGIATSTGSTTDVKSDGSVNAGSGSKTSGLIYLEEGKTYTFSGTADDSLVVTVGGTTVVTTTWGGGGQISGTFTAKASGYYPIEVYHANQAGPGSYDLNIKVGSGTAVDLSSANIPMYQSVADMATAGLTASDLHTVNGQSYYDGYKLNEGPEGGSVKLVGITAGLTDTDGSESLSVSLSGIPAGSVLSDGAGHTIKVGGTPVDVTGWKLSSLTLTPPAYYEGKFTIAVTATATESLGGSDSTPGQIPVTVYKADYKPAVGTTGNDTLTGGESNDIIVADVSGLNVVQGKNYNIAFMVDSSGSMSEKSIADAKAQLASVFNSLKASLGSDASGTVNIFLADFDSQVNKNVSVNLADSNALSKLQAVLNSMLGGEYYGGGTNYEDVFKATANFFKSTMATSNTGAENLTYFITDGKPTFWQNQEDTNPRLWRGTYLDDVVNVNNFKIGDYFDKVIDGQRLTITSSGDVYVNNSYRSLGTIHAQGDGTYEISSRAGSGNSSSWDSASDGSAASFKLLSGLTKVQAIGLNNDVSWNDLKEYDSAGKPQTNIDPSKLAAAILGHTEATVPGSDSIDGGNGNDIIFGDLITLNGVVSEGYQGLQEYVAQKSNVDVSTITAKNVHQYIAEHYTEFDISGANDGNDILTGGNGNDILFGQGGIDRLDGGRGNDILLGGSGDDFLIGGHGDDTLIGGAGKDTFIWKAGDYGNDVIKDFKVGEKDKIDLSDLLQGEKGSTIDNYLKLTTVEGTTTLQVSSEGKLNDAGGLANADVTIKLEGVNWSNTTVNSLISGADPTIIIHNKDS
ncbi:retention module-containing protein [Pseudomonas putida]